jgi:hypothetical protein
LSSVIIFIPPLPITFRAVSPVWDIILSQLQRPVKAKPLVESGHRQLADVVAGQPQRALAQILG